MSNDTTTEPLYCVTETLTDGDGKIVSSDSTEASLLTLNNAFPLVADPNAFQSRPWGDGLTVSYLIRERTASGEWREVDDPRTYEFAWAPTTTRLGTLLVTDVELMLRPAQPGQHYRQCPYNTGRVWDIMSLGDQPVDGPVVWHINAPGMTADQAATKLDSIWHAYFDSYSLANWHINGEVVYAGALGKELEIRHYGMGDAHFRGTVYVYTKEFNDWVAAHSHGEPDHPDWNVLLSRVVKVGRLTPVPFDELEARLAAGFLSRDATRLMVVRPSDNDAGYATRGFWLRVED